MARTRGGARLAAGDDRGGDRGVRSGLDGQAWADRGRRGDVTTVDDWWRPRCEEIPTTTRQSARTAGQVLGIVGERYRIVQNEQALQFVDQLLGSSLYRGGTVGSLTASVAFSSRSRLSSCRSSAVKPLVSLVPRSSRRALLIARRLYHATTRSRSASLPSLPGRPPRHRSYMRSAVTSAMVFDALVTAGIPGAVQCGHTRPTAGGRCSSSRSRRRTADSLAKPAL